MSTLESKKNRLRGKPNDYTYRELVSLLTALGFTEASHGHASGSRVKFYRPSDQMIISLHQPHGNDHVLKRYAINDIYNALKNKGDI